MADKPASSDLPRWAETAAEVEADIVIPTDGKKDTGWVANEKPPAQFFNWIQNRSYKWLRWLDGLISQNNTTKDVDVKPDPVSGADTTGGKVTISAGDATGDEGSAVEIHAARSGQASGSSVRTAEKVLAVTRETSSGFDRAAMFLETGASGQGSIKFSDAGAHRFELLMDSTGRMFYTANTADQDHVFRTRQGAQLFDTLVLDGTNNVLKTHQAIVGDLNASIESGDSLLVTADNGFNPIMRIARTDVPAGVAQSTLLFQARSGGSIGLRLQCIETAPGVAAGKISTSQGNLSLEPTGNLVSTANFLPSGSRDIGASGTRWSTVYATTTDTSGLTVGGSTSTFNSGVTIALGSLNVAAGPITAALEIASSSAVTGTVFRYQADVTRTLRVGAHNWRPADSNNTSWSHDHAHFHLDDAGTNRVAYMLLPIAPGQTLTACKFWASYFGGLDVGISADIRYVNYQTGFSSLVFASKVTTVTGAGQQIDLPLSSNQTLPPNRLFSIRVSLTSPLGGGVLLHAVECTVEYDKPPGEFAILAA